MLLPKISGTPMRQDMEIGKTDCSDWLVCGGDDVAAFGVGGG